MAEIVDIAAYRTHAEQGERSRMRSIEPEGPEARGAASRPAGVLLQFPVPFDGPLFAAAIALLALLARLASPLLV